MAQLHERSDLLDLIQKALDSGTDQERKDLLAAALERIKALNGEYDKVCVSRAESNRARKEAEEERDALASRR